MMFCRGAGFISYHCFVGRPVGRVVRPRSLLFQWWWPGGAAARWLLVRALLALVVLVPLLILGVASCRFLLLFWCLYSVLWLPARPTPATIFEAVLLQ